jgi:hypothetical protein
MIAPGDLPRSAPQEPATSPNLPGRKLHWGKYRDYDVCNDPNLNTTVLGATLLGPIIFRELWAIRAVLLVHS